MDLSELNIAEPFLPLFDEDNPHYHDRFLVFHGGRGSGKSIAAGDSCIVKGYRKKEKILCFRQFQNSIGDSVLPLLDQEITDLGLRDFYDVQRNAIYGRNGTEFIFKGIHNNLNSIRSLQGVTIAWGEEVQTLREEAYKVLIPTIREQGSQFILTYNPDLESDPTYQRFQVSPPPNAHVVEVNYDQNPFFPDVLREDMEWCRQTDVDAYMHIWRGMCRIHSAAQIMNGKWEISRFDPPPGVEYLHGVDFGFAVDPTTAVRCYIHDGCLYIYQECYKHRLDIDVTADAFKHAIPGIEDYIVRGDSARPETISYLQRHGIPNMVGVDKWPGSVEDGISVLRSFKKIIIHEQCIHTIQEAKLYSYKKHAQTGDILPEPLDANNHIWDAVRYALAPMIRQSGDGHGWMTFMKEQVDKHKAVQAGIDTPPRQ